MSDDLSLRRKLIIMLSVMASLFLVALDQTIVATALSRIVADFDAYDSLSWIVTAYLLTTTITIPIAGKLSDLYGRRIMLLIGVAIFTAGSFMSGAAGNVEQLILWRAIQGIGGGIITANAFTIIGDLFPPRERGRWQGLFGAVFGLSSVIGPLLGGWLTGGHQIFGVTTDWRWIFYVNVPVAILAFVMIIIFCPKLGQARRPAIDYAGAVLLSVALATLVLAVDNTASIFADFMRTAGLNLVTLRVIMYTIVVAAVAGFIFVERRAKEPVLALSFFENRNFLLIMGISVLYGAAFIGSILYLTQFNQQVFGASPMDSGLMLLPMVGGLILTSVISGQIISRTGHYKVFMQVGIVVATVAVWLLANLSPQSSYLYEAVVTAFLGAGLGVVLPVINLAIQNEFSQAKLGVATSSNQLFRSLGSTVGVAVFGAMLTAGLTSGLAGIQNDSYVRALEQNTQIRKIGDFNNPNTLVDINEPVIKDEINAGFRQQIASLPPPERAAAAAEFSASQQQYSDKVAAAFSDSLGNIFRLAAGLMAAAAVLVFMLKERPLRATMSTEDA